MSNEKLALSLLDIRSHVELEGGEPMRNRRIIKP